MSSMFGLSRQSDNYVVGWKVQPSRKSDLLLQLELVHQNLERRVKRVPYISRSSN